MDNLKMDGTGDPTAALVMLAFLQADCQDAELRKELRVLSDDLYRTRDINCHDHRIDPEEDGHLETDGQLSACVSCVVLHGIQPSVELQGPGNHEAVANIQQVAAELREIAAQIEESVMAQAIRNLTRNTSSPSELRSHLTLEVERIMRHGIGLEHLPQERVFMALTFTLVKGVCEQAPQLLRSLFNAALQFVSPPRAR